MVLKMSLLLTNILHLTGFATWTKVLFGVFQPVKRTGQSTRRSAKACITGQEEGMIFTTISSMLNSSKCARHNRNIGTIEFL